MSHAKHNCNWQFQIRATLIAFSRSFGRSDMTLYPFRYALLVAVVVFTACCPLLAQVRSRNVPIANDYVAVWTSPAPAEETGGPVSMIQLPAGRLIVTFTNWRRVEGKQVTTDKVYTSDDHGRTWDHRADVPINRQRVFQAGKAVYMLGGQERLLVSRSDDEGATWSDPVPITDDGPWGGEPINQLYTNGRVYIVNERTTVADVRGWPAAVYAPVVMSAPVDADLTRRDAWTFSNILSFRDVRAKYGDPNLIGVPFYAEGFYAPDNKDDKRPMYEIGWTEPNLVQIVDPEHVWFDPAGHTFHLLLRAHTGSTNLACLAKAIESPDGKKITVDLERAPSGEPMLYLPFPGGQMRFYIVYDQPTRLSWMVATQTTDSMTRVELLPPKRWNIPNNERHRLALYFSKNCVDWCFAAPLAVAADVGQSRHNVAAVIDGDDLHFVSRTAGPQAKNAHSADLITFHTVKSFRDLVY